MGRLVLGLFLFGIGLIVDAFNTVVDFCRGSYPDKLLTDKVWDAVVVFTMGFIIVGGMLWLFFAIRSCTQ